MHRSRKISIRAQTKACTSSTKDQVSKASHISVKTPVAASKTNISAHAGLRRGMALTQDQRRRSFKNTTAHIGARGTPGCECRPGENAARALEDRDAAAFRRAPARHGIVRMQLCAVARGLDFGGTVAAAWRRLWTYRLTGTHPPVLGEKPGGHPPAPTRLSTRLSTWLS